MMNKTPNDYYNNRLQPPKAFYEWCYKKLPAYVWKNKERTIVSSTQKHNEVIEKRLTKNSRLTFVDKQEYFEIVLCTSKRIEHQVYGIRSTFDDGFQQFEVRLINMHLYTDNKHIKITKSFSGDYFYGIKYLGSMFQRYEPYLYSKKWKERLAKTSELKYLNLDGVELDELPFYYHYRDRIEYMQNIKAKGIEYSFVNGRLDCRVVTINWLKKWKLYIRNSEHTFEHVKLKQEIEGMGGKMVDGVEKYLTFSQVDQLPEQMSLVRFQNYLIRQKRSFGYYKDYLRMLGDLGWEITNKRRFPKNLEEAHDEALDTLDLIEYEGADEEIEMRASELIGLEMTISDYVFILPKTTKDFIKEGRALNHCVKTAHYIEGHAEGRTTIIFIRKKGRENESYFTLEYKEKQIQQIQSTRNRVKPPEELKKATEMWLDKANQIISKELKKVA